MTIPPNKDHDDGDPKAAPGTKHDGNGPEGMEGRDAENEGGDDGGKNGGTGEESPRGSVATHDGEPPGADGLRSDEAKFIIWSHEDAAKGYEFAAAFERRVTVVLGSVGVDASRPLRLELRRYLSIMYRLREAYFADLD